MARLIFLATTGNGIARSEASTDGSWSVTTPLSDQRVQCLACDPHAPQVVYAGTQHHGVLHSLDGGEHWQELGLPGQNVKALAVSPLAPEILYAGTKPASLFVSRDAGVSWTELTAFRRIRSRRLWFSPAERPFSAYVQAITLSPTTPDILVVGIEFGAVVKSEDGGLTWTDHRPGALRDCHSLRFHANDGDWVYEAGGSGAGVSVSRDAGNTWMQPKDGLDWHYGWAVAADPGRPDIWYASVAPNAWKAHSERNAKAAIIRTVEGKVWQTLAGGLPQPLNHMPYALLPDPNAPSHLYAGLNNGDVWHATGYGEIWRRLPLNLGSIDRTLLLLPQ